MADSYPPEQRPSQAAALLEDRKPVLLPRASSSTTATTTMLSERYILEPSPDYPLYIFAKRYWAPEFEQHAKDPAAATLIVLHSTSFHKETWEPALEDLFSLAVQSKSLGLIREAWTIDCPNHGEAGERNRHTLRGPDFIHFSCEKYAEAVHRFLTHSPGGVSFRRRRLIGIGHSLGANTMIILQSIQPVMDFARLIIVEPMVSPEGPEILAILRERLVRRARKRTKCWPTLEEAKKDYGQPKRHGAKWDPRVLDLFINHALHWKTKVQSFGLSCMRQQEVAMYMDEEGPIKPVKILNELCSRVPVHLVLGGVYDLIPPGVHTTLVDPKSGRTFATVTTLPEVGHLIPQESPTELAAHIFEVLSNSSGPVPCRL